MRLGLVSDLHADISSQPPIEWPECDALIVNGDTGNSIGAVVKVLERISRRTEIPMILVNDGNHEHYSNAPQERTIAETNTRLLHLMPKRCIFLPAHRVLLDPTENLWAIGRCGWYCFRLNGRDLVDEVNTWRSSMNDDRWIGFTQQEKLPPWTLAVMHAESIRQAIRDTTEEYPGAQFVIATHTVPHRELLAKGPRWHETNPFYVNTHMEGVALEFGHQIRLWHYGHTHFRSDRFVDGVRYVANPRGYPSENPRWEPVVMDV